MKFFSSSLAFLAATLSLASAAFEHPTFDAKDIRSLFTEDLPLPKDWVAPNKQDASADTWNGGYPQHGGHHHGSFPYGDDHGNDGGYPGNDEHDHDHGHDNNGNAYAHGYPDKMAEVPGAALAPSSANKSPAVRALETAMFKKAQGDQKNQFHLRGAGEVAARIV